MELPTLLQAYYIGELIAAVAVIFSLLFIAQQLRQNTLAIKSQTYASAIDSGQNELVWHGNKEFAQFFQKSINAPENLTKDEIHELNAWNIHLLLGRSNDYELHRMGTLDEERWKMNEPIVRYALSGQWHRNWVKTGGRHFFTGEFIDWVESVLNGSEFEPAKFYKSLNLNG